MSVRVHLSKSIYPRECLEETAAVYCAICSVKVIGETSGAREVVITPVRGDAGQPDEGRIAHEFLNYLLDLSLEHHLQSA
jgi:hypothetical protein